MDFTEVNFDLTSGDQRKKDEQTFREIFEFICHSVNLPVHDANLLEHSDVHSRGRLNKI